MTATTATPRRTRRLLVPMATLLAAAGIAVASGAAFSTSTASTGLAASGTLRQINSNSVAFEKGNLKPGDTVTGSVTITNSGSLPGTFTLTEADVSEAATAFSPKSDVTLEIKQSGTVVSAVKTLGAAGSIPLGTFAAGEARTYDYTVTFASTAANSQQGKTARTTYTFSSVQGPAETFSSVTGGQTESPTAAQLSDN
jgi:spore coat-associated protein N